jgi:ribosome recycling factor
MDQVLSLVKEDLNSVATGRAKPSMIEDIKVEAYAGSILTIKELGNISAPDAHLITINPWDKGVIDQIAKAISSSDLNLNPVVDGELVRISVPALTQERREELVKAVKQKVESGKSMLRQVRNDIKRDIDGQKDTAGVSEDDIFAANEDLQKLIDDFNKTLDDLEQNKEKELMTV